METGSVIVIFLSAIVGGGLAFLLNGKSIINLKLILSFGAAYLIGLCALHLLPPIYNSDLSSPGIFILIGFVLQILLEFLSNGIEHGHLHHDTGSDSGSFPYLLMISLGIHSIIEGMPFGEHGHHHHNHSLLLGIVVHKLPVAFVLGSLFLKAKIGWKKSMFWILLFACMSPLGAFIHNYLSENMENQVQNLIPMVLGILVGILLHVATTIIFESSDGHKFNLSKLISIFIGILTAFLLL